MIFGTFHISTEKLFFVSLFLADHEFIEDITRLWVLLYQNNLQYSRVPVNPTKSHQF